MSNDLPERRTPPSSDEEKQPSLEEAKAALDARREAITRHSDALQRELGESGKAATSFVSDNPWAVLGGAVATGLGISLLRERSKRRRRATENTQRLLTELYMDALADDVNYQVQNGRDPDEAVYDALQDRVPLIFVEGESKSGKDERSFLRQTLDLAIKTAFGFAVKSGLDYMTDRIGFEDFASDEEEGKEAATVATATEEAAV